MKKIKICLYLEFLHFGKGFLFKNIGTGLLSSYKNQKKALESLDIEYVEKWDDSCDILQINTPWIWSLYLIKKAKRQGKKVVIWSHVTVEDFKKVFRFNKFIAPLMKRYLTYAYGLADMVFCPSEYTKTLLIAYGLPEEKLHVQSNGVDSTVFYKDDEERNRAREGEKINGLVVGTVGLVIPRKGVDIFLRLAEEFKQNQFVWFGKIYNKLMVQSLPKTLPENVKFTGFVNNINESFNALDIFVFLSEEENQGMVLLEAAAIGLPILARDLPAYRGWMEHNKNCLIAKNEAEISKYLEMLIKDEELRKRLSEGALKLAKKEDITVLRHQLLETYEKLLQK